MPEKPPSSARSRLAAAVPPPAAPAAPPAQPEPVAPAPAPAPAAAPDSSAIERREASAMQTTTAALRSAVAPRAGVGVMVAGRVLPPEVADVVNELMSAASSAFGITQGQVLGTVLLVAMAHQAEVFSLLEDSYGFETMSATKQRTWAAARDALWEGSSGVVNGNSE